MGKKRDRLYYREGRGWYMDLRDLGEGRKACVPEGERSATFDRDEAVAILSARVEKLKAGVRATEDPTLKAYAEHHLEVKAGFRRQSTVSRDERALRNVVAYFGEDIRLSEIGVEGLTAYLAYRRQQPGARKGTTISPQTLLHELHALSSLYKRAVAEGKAKLNPVRRLPEKPRVRHREAVWLEPGEAARLLAAAGHEDAHGHSRSIGFLRPLLATFLLTGGRWEEVTGLLRRDVDLEEGVVHFRANAHRRLKRDRHRRWVPLWPQLREILEAYLEANPRAPGALLFPSPTGGMLTDIRGGLGNAVDRAKIEKHVTPHTFRHTYAAARLQTTDQGAPVSPYTLMRELGHSSLKLIEDTYGHLTHTRHRSPVVEYREGKVVGDVRGAREARGA